jgi:hypothetical protein
MRPIFQKEILRAEKGQHSAPYTPKEGKGIALVKMASTISRPILKSRGTREPPFSHTLCVNTV